MASGKKTASRGKRHVHSLGGDNEAQLELHPDDEERLYFAIDIDETVLLRMLLENGNINPSSRFPGHLGKSALQLCCEKGRLECARVLLEAGANTDAQDDWYHTPLVSSVSTGRQDMVKLLVDAGCNTEVKDKLGKTAVHYAVCGCETGCLLELINASASVDALDDIGRTPVWLAAEADGRTDYMRMLIEADCDVNVKDKREKRSPLQVAILKANTSVVEYVRILLDAGASTNVVDLLGMSPLSCLIHKISSSNLRGEILQISQRHLEVARLILDGGYDVNYTSSAHYPFQFHGTSLKMAVDRGIVPIVELLIDYGADPDACDDKNSTPLHLAICNDFLEIGKLLIRANCSFDRRAEMTFYDHVIPSLTPFACAAILARADFLEIILRTGYDVRGETVKYHDLMTLAHRVRGSREFKDFDDRIKWCYDNPVRLEDISLSLARRLLGQNIEKKVKSMDLPFGTKNKLLLVDVL